LQGKTKRKKEEPLGFALCTSVENGIVILEGLFVMPEYQKMGVGERLIEELKKDGDIHTQSFAESVGFYKKQGFREISYREHDDTTEMFTGDYEFNYEYEYMMPQPRAEDGAHMAYLRNIELQA
jgi:GNAT superfamily N-acetyltransferase